MEEQEFPMYKALMFSRFLQRGSGGGKTVSHTASVVNLGGLTLFFSLGVMVGFHLKGRFPVFRKQSSHRPINPSRSKRGAQYNCVCRDLDNMDGGSVEAKAARLGEEDFKAAWNMTQDLILAQGINVFSFGE